MFTVHGRDSQALDLEEAEIHWAHNAIDKRKGGLYRVARDGGLACPFIEGPPRKITDDALTTCVSTIFSHTSLRPSPSGGFQAGSRLKITFTSAPSEKDSIWDPARK